jgi:CRP/FNR family transcriptional regulator, cyclic AMP receptor protein
MPSAAQESPDDTGVAALAAHLLTMPSALAELSPQDADFVIGYTLLRHFAAGTTVIAQGERDRTGFMFLVLDGDVSVETVVVSRANPLVMSVMGPGSLLGEMGLLDGAPRAASCIALTDMTAAILTRSALAALIDANPGIGAKLMIAISQRLAERLREGGQKLLAYTQLTRAMQQEIESLDPSSSSRRSGGE